MPEKRSHTPSYRLHKPSGQARVIIDGEHNYLGRYDSPESHEKYHRLSGMRWKASVAYGQAGIVGMHGLPPPDFGDGRNDFRRYPEGPNHDPKQPE